MPESAQLTYKSIWPWTGATDKSIYSSRGHWPKISIVTPSYNQGRFIEETILSVLNQNYPNLEYFIIDGGSTDNSVEIITKYAEKLTYWVSEKDQGQADAINKGILKCTGVIFNWINSDDLLAENALFVIAEEYFKNPEFKIIAGGCALIKDGIFFEYRYNRQNLTFEGLISGKSNFQQPSQWLNFTNNKTLLNKDFHYAFDWDLILNLHAGESGLVYTDKLLSYYRDHSKSKTNNFGRKFLEEKLQIVKIYCRNNKNSRWALLKYQLILEAYLSTSDALQNGDNLLQLLKKNPEFIFSRFYISNLFRSIFKSNHI